ncbi:peptidoglycan-binding protein LysM [Neisseria weaveri]|uniref:Potassium binding protein Kbp n=1 Tax=Neisseria weaveri TaxID=28091 RepID=A0A3S5C362_9NEIS|nr:peptidoglycan-binding protein LysM [Neisseria weaveri]EGV35298.1 Peptidoglycan-binding LysM [Neisseria weaveri ATCC 51223]EGV37062.1 Peptidoglycan-binding LysM [Neisseria weaveri LMG 5135]SAY51130.1 LysM domain/BON superfamily protein [Neisseria weaveri]VEJ49740.1 LysM domain/BON superfamily protein [Neisseria weaveri]
MGLFSFIKNAGEKLFGKDEKEVAAAAAANVEDLNQKASAAIQKYIETQNLGLTGLAVSFDGASGKVTLKGSAPSQEAAEKAVLAAGNVTGVSDVDNLLDFPAAAAAQYHDVVSGDTLSAIAKKYYGDANKYMKIFEANKPMLSDPNKIYPGQKLRIPE